MYARGSGIIGFEPCQMSVSVKPWHCVKIFFYMSMSLGLIFFAFDYANFYKYGFAPYGVAVPLFSSMLFNLLET